MTEYVGPIEKETRANTYFRRVLFTGRHSQLVVMCLAPGEDIGDEVHPNVDQFFRIEQGDAKFVFNQKQERPARATLPPVSRSPATVPTDATGTGAPSNVRVPLKAAAPEPLNNMAP